MNGFHSITIPQLNVNDDTVTLIEWSVPHGSFVETDTPVSVVETSKAANELCAERPGVLYHLMTPVKKVKVGEEIGLIGPSLPEIEHYLAERARQASAQAAAHAAQPPSVTPRARKLLEEHGITEADILASGAQGAIKEKDVLAWLESRNEREKRKDTAASDEHPAPSGTHAPAGAPSPLPAAIRMLLDDEGRLPAHEEAVADVLAASCRGLLLTTAEAEIDLTHVNEYLSRSRDQGLMLTLLHCVILASARALETYPRLKSLYAEKRVYAYRDTAIGFVVRSIEGNLFTPVVRTAATLTPAEIARQCHGLTMKINRRSIQQEELTGACFTISHIASPVLQSFRALPNAFQSAILAVAGERTKLALTEDGRCREVPVCTVTLSYDHALLDGVYAAGFLQALADELDRIAHG